MFPQASKPFFFIANGQNDFGIWKALEEFFKYQASWIVCDRIDIFKQGLEVWYFSLRKQVIEFVSQKLDLLEVVVRLVAKYSQSIG